MGAEQAGRCLGPVKCFKIFHFTVIEIFGNSATF